MIQVACSGQPMPRHIMVFDRPFLVLMTKKDAARPYFAMWVGNPWVLGNS